MGYVPQTGVSRRRATIRCYRSAALSTSTSGTFVVVPWDAESTTPAKTNITHSTSSSAENITCQFAGSYLVAGLLKLTGGTWDELRVSVEVNGAAQNTPNAGSASGLLGLTAEPGSVSFSQLVHVAANDVVRVRVASVGQSTVALDVGETDAWVELFLL